MSPETHRKSHTCVELKDTGVSATVHYLSVLRDSPERLQEAFIQHC